jgi:serine/threonine protein phosphatase PrpC
LLIVETFTHPGLVRTNNEDLALWDADLTALVVADGMGGHNAGEVASRLAIDATEQFLRSTAGEKTARWPFGFDVSLSTAANRLRTAFLLANREILRTSEERIECAGMGTTMTAALAEGSKLTFASVGDTRLYVLRGGHLHQLTRDDSVLGSLSDVPGVDPAALESHPLRHLLTNVLGRRTDMAVSVQETELIEDDLLLMSTDGLHGSVDHESIVEVLGAATDLQAAANRLVQLALDAGGRDNVSGILARYTP